MRGKKRYQPVNSRMKSKTRPRQMEAGGRKVIERLQRYIRKQTGYG